MCHTLLHGILLVCSWHELFLLTVRTESPVYLSVGYRVRVYIISERNPVPRPLTPNLTLNVILKTVIKAHFRAQHPKLALRTEFKGNLNLSLNTSLTSRT